VFKFCYVVASEIDKSYKQNLGGKMKPLLLKETGFWPEKKEAYYDYGSPQYHEDKGFNEAITEIEEIDLSAWLKENNYIQMDGPLECYSCGADIKYDKNRPECYCNDCMPADGELKDKGYIKLQDVELCVEKIAKLIRKKAVQTHCDLDSDNLSTWKCTPTDLATAIKKSKPYKEKT